MRKDIHFKRNLPVTYGSPETRLVPDEVLIKVLRDRK